MKNHNWVKLTWFWSGTDCDWDSSGPIRPVFQLEVYGNGPKQLVVSAPKCAGRIGGNAEGDTKENFFTSGNSASSCKNLAGLEDSLLGGVGRCIVGVSGSGARVLCGGDFDRRLSQFNRAARLKTDGASDGLPATERSRTHLDLHWAESAPRQIGRAHV